MDKRNHQTPADMLTEALENAGLHVNPATWDALAMWVRSVEERLSWIAPIASPPRDGVGLGRGYYGAPNSRAHCGKCLQGFDSFDAAKEHAARCDGGNQRQPDATTAALQRKVAEHEIERRGLQKISERRRDGLTETPPDLQATSEEHLKSPEVPTAPKTHGRCGGVLETVARDGKAWERCPKCGSSWLAKPSARPQSPLVSDDQASDRVGPHVANKQIVALLRELLHDAAHARSAQSVSHSAVKLLDALRDMRSKRIEFGIKEVLP